MTALFGWMKAPGCQQGMTPGGASVSIDTIKLGSNLTAEETDQDFDSGVAEHRCR